MTLALNASACSPPEETRQQSWSDPPGSAPWNADVTCDVDSDCLNGEVCESGVCQMRRCAEDYASAPPLGSFRYLGMDSEIAVVGDDRFIDAFESGDSYLGSLELDEDAKIQDVTGGNFNGQRPQGVAIAVRERSVLLMHQSDGVSELELGFEPAGVGAGDVDRDGLEEVVAFGFDGQVAVCDVDTHRCAQARLEGLEGRDVTVGDVDADGYDEPVLLYEDGDDEGLLVWNMDHEHTGQDETRAWSLGFDAKEIAAGDVFGLGRAVVVIKHEGGWFDQRDDKLQIFDAESEQIIASHSINGHTIDVAVGDRDGDDRVEIVTLREDHQLEVFRARVFPAQGETTDGETAEEDTELSLEQLDKTAISVGSRPSRVAVVDWNGDSPAGRLVEGPSLLAGLPVPVTVMVFPPYPHGASSGALSARVAVGQNESSDETFSDSVSLHLGMTATFGLEAGPFKAKVSASLSQDWTTTRSTTHQRIVGSRHSVLAEPDLHGHDYAAVVLSSGCYHRYRYETDDPANKLGGGGQIAELMVPVGGQTQLWSSKRYNALAEALRERDLAHLPSIEVPIRVGDPSSYPSAPTTLGGEPIAAEDMLFPETQSFQLSDVGYVGFHMIAGETTTNASAQTTTIGASAGFGAFGSGIDVDTSIGVSQGYSLSVGHDALFAGSVPPVPDNPDTPEDDYALHRLSFTPVVYRQRYADAAGAESGYYVIYYWRDAN